LAASLEWNLFAALQGKGTKDSIRGDCAYLAGHTLGLLEYIVLGCFSYD
jgi:hypothetical protein